MTLAQDPTGRPQAPDAQVALAFRDSTELTRWLKVLLYASIAGDIAGFVSRVFEFFLLQDMRNGAIASTDLTAVADANDTRQQILGIIRIVLFATTGICFLVWIYRANANARALGAQNMKFTPGASVGWYFAPIANLVKPYQAMKEIWQASADPIHWQAVRRGSVLPWWWTLFLVSSLLGNFAYYVQRSAKQFDDFVASNVLIMAGDVIGVVLGLVAITLVTQIFQMQIAHARRSSPAMPPPPILR